MSKQPLVSIIIPTYNRANLIGETLDSVLAQTYINWECIVVDDGSTDGTVDLINMYCDKDVRFQYHNRPIDRLSGGNAARNHGFALSSGEYIMFLDSDDLLRFSCLENRVHYFFDFLHIDFVVFQSQMFKSTRDDSVLIPNALHKKTEDLKRFISYDYPWNISATLIKREFLTSHKISWDETLKMHQDLEFYIRILLLLPKYKKIETVPDVFIRMGTDDKISNREIDKQTLNSKYLYQNKIMVLLNKAGYNNKEYILRMYGLSLFNCKLFVKSKNYLLLLKIANVYIGQGNVKYGLTLIPDVLYLVFKEKIKYYKIKVILKNLENLFYGYRFEYLPPVGSTLGKIKLQEYLENLGQ